MSSGVEKPKCDCGALSDTADICSECKKPLEPPPPYQDVDPAEPDEETTEHDELDSTSSALSAAAEPAVTGSWKRRTECDLHHRQWTATSLDC